jgi:hypothetical protein
MSVFAHAVVNHRRHVTVDYLKRVASPGPRSSTLPPSNILVCKKEGGGGCFAGFIKNNSWETEYFRTLFFNR